MYMEEEKRSASGSEAFQIEESLHTLADGISDPQLTAAIEQIIDAFENKKTALADLAYRDGETGLFNNIYYMGRLREEVSRALRYNRELSLLIIELGGGFSETLSETAGAISEALRRSDTYARIGGREFAALLPETNTPQAERVAEKILNSIQPFSIETTVEAWIGIAAFNSSRDNAVKLEAAAYQARDKAKGRNTPVYSL